MPSGVSSGEFIDTDRKMILSVSDENVAISGLNFLISAIRF